MNSKKKNKGFKKWAGKVHLWLGLASGLIVFIVAVTGCIFVFHDEIKDFTRDYRKVAAVEASYILPSQLQEKASGLFPGMSTDMIVYQGKNRSAFIYGIEDGAEYNVYFNPYTGEFLQKEKLEEDFFLIIEDLHMHLLLPEAIGKQIVGISTIIFILMLISGIILWWPKKKKNLKQRLNVKWIAKWRRVNYDWHSVSGFYVSLIALVIALTGLTFAYEWMHETMYYIGNFGRNYYEEEAMPAVDTGLTFTGDLAATDKAMLKTFEEKPLDEMYFVWDQGNKLPIITGSYPKALHFDHQTNFYFHPVTGDLLKEQLYKDKSGGTQLQEMNYGLHTGQYFGITGKIIAFVASLFVAVLPVSGFMIWWGRKNKPDK